MRELDEVAVEVVRRRMCVLEEEDGSLELDLPRRAHRLHEEPEAAADDRRGDPPAADRPHPRVVGVVRHLARSAGPEDIEKPVRRERRRLDGADAHQAVPVDRRDSRPLADRHVQRGEIRVADERLRVLGDEVEVHVRDGLRRAEAALERLHDVHLGVGEECVQILAATARIPGDVVVAIPDAVGELHAVPASLPPLDAAEDVRAAVIGARGRGHADGAAVGKRPAEPRRCDHLQIRTVWLASASRPRTSEATAVSVCAPLRLPPVRQVIS